MGEIDDLLCHPQARTELSAAGFKAAKDFTWTNTAEQFLSMLDERQQQSEGIPISTGGPSFSVPFCASI